MPVHLNGLPACMNKIRKISKKYNLHIIEDAAQSILSTYLENILEIKKSCMF